MEAEKLNKMDEEADKVIAGWTMGAFCANLLPPPFDVIAIATVFAKMGSRLGEIYEVKVSYNVMKSLAMGITKGIGGWLAAYAAGSELLKWIPGLNVWIALLIQPPIVAAVAYSAGNAFKEYFHVHISGGKDLTPEQLQKLAEESLRNKLAT